MISFDATSGGLRHTMRGSILINMECNPLQGPEVETVIKQLEAGEEPEKYHYVEEQIFVNESEIGNEMLENLPYDINVVTEKVLKEREY